jgi:UDP-glucose 4-epimerase
MNTRSKLAVFHETFGIFRLPSPRILGHVLALNKLLDPEFCGVKVYNLGTGKGISVLEMVHAFEEAAGVKIPLEMAGRRAGDVAASYATCDLAEKELGFKCKYTLLDMCKDTWTWQSKNPKGFVENS